MPIGAPTSYPLVSEVMLLARSLVNDSMAGANDLPGEGQILTNDPAISPFTQPFLNSAIRWLYRKLGNSGVPTLINDNLIVSGLIPVATANPAIQVSLTFAGYNNGSTVDATKVLPANTLSVLKMWQRETSSGNSFSEMIQAMDGLPSANQGPAFGLWEYRADGVYMVGSTGTRDLRLRTIVSLPGQISGAGTDFGSLSIPVQDSTDALATKVAEFYSFARGSDQVEALHSAAEELFNELSNRQIRQRQAVGYQRAPYNSSAGASSGGLWLG
jgi:hypothetical protein